jgi:uncharacterized RDD family membrane protein YckC
MAENKKIGFTESAVGFQGEVRIYAGFWWRSLAALVDFFIFTLIVSIVLLLVRPIIPRQFSVEAHFCIELCVFLLLSFVYYPLCEASGISATAGKRLLGITVKTKDDGRVSILRATIRHVVRIFSGFLYMSGFVICALTRHKQSAHDYVTRTYVVRIERPIGLDKPRGRLASGAINMINSCSTLMVGTLSSVIALLLLVSLIAASATFAEAARLRSIGSNLVMATLPMRQHAEMNVDKAGRYPESIPDEVLGRISLPSSVSVKYEGGKGIVTLLLNDPKQKGSNGLIKLTPIKNRGGVIWACEASLAIAEIMPFGCVTIKDKTGV